MHGKIKEHVSRHSTVYTDELRSYAKLAGYRHFTINHSQRYVSGHVHVNNVENFWNLLKRTIKGTYVCPRPWHLQRYVEEQVFRFNECDGNDAYRFNETVKSIVGKRITYKELTKTVNMTQAKIKNRQRLAAMKRLAARREA